MTALVQGLNLLLTRLFDLICWPFGALAPIWALIVISFLTGILMLWLWGKISNQEGIKQAKNQIRGNLIGVRLFQDDLRITLRLQGRILRHTLTYMRYAVVPMLVLLIPVILVMIQLNLRFSVRPLEPGRQTLLEAKVRDLGTLGGSIELLAPEGVVVETPAVRNVSAGEVTWRVRAERPGHHKVTVRAGQDAVEKTLVVGSSWGKVSALRTGKNLWEMLLWPGEAPIHPAGAIESVEVRYPALAMPLFGWNIHWLVYFFVLSLAFGYAFKGVFGVQI